MNPPAELVWVERPVLRRPILLVAFTGLFDVAEVATGALAHLAARPGARTIASIDPDGFYDFTNRRPLVRLDHEGRRQIDWPLNELVVVPAATHPTSRQAGEHDLVVLRGVEPHLRWRTFAGLVVEAATALGVELTVTLGAAAAAVPHTRRPAVVGSSTVVELARRLGLATPTYEGPTGQIGVLLDALDRAGRAAVSLRVPVPHYALGTAHPLAVQALLAHVQHVTGTPTGHGELDGEVVAQRRRVDEAVGHDGDVGRYVEQLERRHDAELASWVPTGDELAEELERFLRDAGGDPPTAGS